MLRASDNTLCSFFIASSAFGTVCGVKAYKKRAVTVASVSLHEIWQAWNSECLKPMPSLNVNFLCSISIHMKAQSPC